jgi:hypothetical protein
MDSFRLLLTELGVSPQTAVVLALSAAAFWFGFWCKGAINGGEINALKGQKALADDRLGRLAERSTGDAETIALLQDNLTSPLSKRSSISTLVLAPTSKTKQRLG